MKKNAPKILLVVALVAVVGMGFRVSWNALRDVAATIGADWWAALLYPFVVDGLMALALVATLVLTGQDRTFALWVLGGYTVASLVLNYVHGLGPTIAPTAHAGAHDRLADYTPANVVLVLLASSLPVGSIFFGSDLVAKVLHHKPEPAENAQESTNQSMPDLPEHLDADLAESVYESPDRTADPAPTAPPTGPVPAEPLTVVKSVAAPVSRPRRATGKVPQSARAARPVRSFDDLLAEARSKTGDWPDGELTGEAIRLAVRTSATKARALRDALKADRQNPAPGTDDTAEGGTASDAA